MLDVDPKLFLMDCGPRNTNFCITWCTCGKLFYVELLALVEWTVRGKT